MGNTKRPPDGLVSRLVTFLEEHLPPARQLALGLSGGLDSVALLDLLLQARSRLALELTALHVNHRISPNATRWADFCRGLCDKAGVPLEVVSVDVPRDSPAGLEAAARELRYRVFARCQAVALAHHRDDQAETLLLNVLRGSGVGGGGMLPVRPYGATRILRPLLDTPREAVLSWATSRNLKWVEDESNADIHYRRNYLRHQVIPVLESVYPATREMLARSAGHLSEAAQLLDEMAREDAVGFWDGESLAVSVLLQTGRIRAKNLLRNMIRWSGADPLPASRLEEALRQLCFAAEDARPCIAWGGWELRRYRGRAWVVPAFQSTQFQLIWDGACEVVVPGGVLKMTPSVGSGISVALVGNRKVIFRNRCGGESMRLHPRATRRTLKHIFQELGVPPWMRERLPLILVDNELACVPGVAVSCEFQAREGEEGIVASLF